MCFFQIVDEILEYAYVLKEHLEVFMLILPFMLIYELMFHLNIYILNTKKILLLKLT